MKRTLSALFVLVASVVILSSSTGRVVKVASIGDSITYGAGLPDRFTQSFPMVLARLLGDGYVVRNFGFNSRTASPKGDFPYLEAKKYDTLKMWTPDVVTVMLGTNDSKPHNWDPEAFREGYELILTQLEALPSHPRILVLLPTPTWENVHQISDQVIKDEIIPITVELAEKHGCTVVDLHTPFEGHREYYKDGVHPDRDGAIIIANMVYRSF